MNFIKNAEISRKYNISPAAVTGWVHASKLGKNNLQLVEIKGKLYVIDNAHNHAEISRLVAQGKKHRSHISVKKVEVKKEFYEIFNDEEIIDIINNIQFKRIIQHKYSYRTIGARCWDTRYNINASPLTKAVDELLDNTIGDLMYLLGNSKKINVIDLGPGNAHPVKSVLEKLQNLKLLEKYIAIDISQEMNQIAIENVQNWFDSKINIKTYTKDVETTRFNEIFLGNKSFSNEITNLIFHIECIYNHEDRIQVLKNIRSGMIKSDLLILTFSVDTLINRGMLNYIKDEYADMQQSWIPKLLGIDVEKCTFKMKFDDNMKCKIKSLQLDKDYVIKFKMFGQEHDIELLAEESISIWRHYVVTPQDFFSEIEKAELKVINFKLDKNLPYAMVICQAKL